MSFPRLICLDIVEAACVVTSLAIEKVYKELHNASHVSDINSVNGNDDILPISSGLYELVTSMEDGWTLTLTGALSVGSYCACPDLHRPSECH